MNFTCSGTVTAWRAAGVFGNSNTNSVLSIWRERSNEPGTYDRQIGGIQLGICGSVDPAPLVVGMSGVYECTLPPNEKVSVQPGHVIGIELPADNRANFRLYFDNTANNAPTNYVFNGHGTTFSQSQAEQASDQPQVSLTVVQDTIATSLPTIQPPSMTEALSTTADLPTTPQPLTSTSMTTTDLEAPTSIIASMTAAAATEPSATTTTEASTTTMSAETQPSATTGSPTPATAVMTNVNSESTAVGSTTTEIPSSTDAQISIPPRGGEAVQSESNTGTIAGAAVGAIIAILLVLIIVLLLVLVLRRQSRNGQKFTPSNNATLVNPIYNGKLIVPSLESVFH